MMSVEREGERGWRGGGVGRKKERERERERERVLVLLQATWLSSELYQSLQECLNYKPIQASKQVLERVTINKA